MKQVRGMGPGEGAARRPGGESAAGEDDVEGHSGKMLRQTGDDEDVEGHGGRMVRATGEDEDVEGNLKRRDSGAATGLRDRDEKIEPEGRRLRESGGDEKDTEGHNVGPRVR